MADKQVDLHGRKVFIGIPAYDGKLNIKTAFALAKLTPVALQHGVSLYLGHMSGCSIITMARNALVNEFLKTDADELLFIDADVIVQPDDVLRLLAQSEGRDILVGMYPRRASDKNFFLDLYRDDTESLVFDGPLLRVKRAGTGFMLIKRYVIESLIAAHPEWNVENRSGDGSVAAVFDFAIKDGKYVGEDYLFCDRATEAGFKCWVDVEISLPHVGSEEFTRDFVQDVIMPLLEDERKSKLKVANA
jgi:ketosteroid isomerase-like protein